MNQSYNTRQHTATHCNTLQHTAAHFNTLPHAATHCDKLQYTAIHCNTLQHTQGANKELYGLQLNQSYNGNNFSKAAYDVYNSSGVMLIAAQDENGTGVLQCVAVCCSVLQCVAALRRMKVAQVLCVVVHVHCVVVCCCAEWEWHRCAVVCGSVLLCRIEVAQEWRGYTHMHIRTATHYNTLQLTATHYNTLQHTATHGTHCKSLHGGYANVAPGHRRLGHTERTLQISS